LIEIGWGSALGYPGFVPEQHGENVEVHVLTSVDLPGHWRRLDDFEGAGSRRYTVVVTTERGDASACIYVVETENDLNGQ
jgi:gamma-glutamylcyclotransferase (GGCT)/AIG2-like uncharacterized protein YtfP